ncbi:MAG: nucleoside triphosphate pyrophosphohydrolase [Pseudomonadota bacterium]
MAPSTSSSDAVQALLELMVALRTPGTGCPWDIEQTFATIAPYTIEEAYEVADAIERNDLAELKSELGDLLFQVVFHAQMATELGAFDFNDVAFAIYEKMKLRHPHVFGSANERSAEQQTVSWEEQKAAERKAKGHQSLLDDVPLSLPALLRAVKLQKRAARVGFDWKTAPEILAKLSEETAELVEANETGDPNKIEDEFGDLLFVMANLARHLRIDPEAALRRANAKFNRRFRHIEKTMGADGRSLAEASLEEMEARWQEAKKLERE